MNVRILERGDAEAYQSLRLAGLQECPSAFASSFAEESGLGLEVVAERLSPSADGVVLGAFADADLAGMVGVHREPLAKLAHKANVWGMYVGPGGAFGLVVGSVASHASNATLNTGRNRFSANAIAGSLPAR